MRRCALVLSLLAVAAGFCNTTIGADAPDCAKRVDWCRPGFVCTPTVCAAESAAQLDLLTADVEALKKRRVRKWACTLGPGAGVYLQVEQSKTTVDAAPLLGAVVCGWTF